MQKGSKKLGEDERYNEIEAFEFLHFLATYSYSRTRLKERAERKLHLFQLI